MKTLILTLLITILSTLYQYPDPYKILKELDKNYISNTKIIHGRMIIYGMRNSREISFITYSKGRDTAFTEYLSPPRQKGVKMLKLGKNLWIYSPTADRTIQLSGHMLKQSLMGSDLSYEDLMEDTELADSYNAKITGETTINGHKCWIILLEAKVPDVTYEKMQIYVDQQRKVILKEELFAKSGQLLKVITMSDYKKYGSRWYPTKMNFKDVLKKGNGTDFIIDKIKFDVKIDDYIFSKAALKK